MAMQYGPRELRQTLSRISLLVAFVTFVSIPLIYALTAIRYESVRLTAEAETDAKAMSRMIFTYPDTWSFQNERIEELLEGNLRSDLPTSKQVIDTNNETVAVVGVEVGSPNLTHEVLLYDGVETAGRIKVTRRVWHIVWQTGMAALLGFVLGAAMFVILRVSPMRALARATAEVEKSAARLAAEVAEREAVEARLRQSQKLEALGQLTGGVAHDFNNLLAIIQGNADLWARKSRAGKKYVDPILRAAERGSNLTSRLLAFARKQPLLPTSVNIAELAKGMHDLLSRTLGETIEIETTAEPHLWSALADAAQVENAILNLALNAKAAMPQGGKLTISCGNVSLSDAILDGGTEVKPGDYVTLAVTDNGTGMTPDVIEHAFEPFFTTKPASEGTGLGLSMVYGFARQSGGNVAIYSELGRGTSIKLYLPRDPRSSISQDKPASTSAPQGNNETVLVIEDEEDVRQVAIEMLETLNYRVIDVSNAIEARAVLDGGAQVDLVLSDVVLPGGLSGPEFAVEARQTYPDLKVIFMSGYPADAAHRNGLVEMDGVLLNKPFRRPQLAQAVRQLLDVS